MIPKTYLLSKGLILAALYFLPFAVAFAGDARSSVEAYDSAKIEMIDGCNPCWGGRLRYTTWTEPVETYDGRRYDGVWVTLIIPDEHRRKNEVTSDRVRVLVDRLDLLYAAYNELLEWHPPLSLDPLGKHVLAFVTTDPASWYGIAHLGDDRSEYSNTVFLETAQDDDILANVWVHEIAHNWDPITIWDYGDDPSHDWTMILQLWFARQQAQWHNGGRKGWEAFQEGWLADNWYPYLANSEMNWARCVEPDTLPQECKDAKAQYLSGLLATKIGQQIPGHQMRDWIRKGWKDQQAGLSYSTSKEKSDQMLAALAQVTQTDTRCIATYAKWHSGSTLAAEASKYTPLFPGCVDSDNDGFIGFKDCDDKDANTNPSATETVDGKDNNCNFVIDERTFSDRDNDFPQDAGDPAAKLSLPFVLEGKLEERGPGERDIDVFLLEKATGDKTRIEVCGEAASLNFWVWGLENGRWWFLGETDGTKCKVETIGRGYTEIKVALKEDSTTRSGNYSFSMTPASRQWTERPIPEIVRESGGSYAANGFSAVQSKLTANAEIRWFLSGRGFIQKGPASAPASWKLNSLPAGVFPTNGSFPQLRAQLWQDEMPVGEPSPPFLVPSQALENPITPDGTHSGAWYSTSHNGEGFILEVLAGGKAVVYWFTYDPLQYGKGKDERTQAWFLADLTSVAGGLRGSLYRFYGNGFGNDLDPSKVAGEVVGSLDLAFGSDGKAVVHFNVAGRTGEYELQPLVRLHTADDASGLSGSWYDPNYNGEGLIVQEFAPGKLLMYLFTYTNIDSPASGKLAWSMLTATVAADGSITMDSTPVITSGGLFGRGFNPDYVSLKNEGQAGLTLTCDGGTLTITLPSISPKQHELKLTRLTNPLNVKCK